MFNVVLYISSPCTECNNSKCLKCTIDFLNYDTEKCETFCPSDAYKDTTNHLCVKCSINYNSGCKECDFSKCTKCNSNYLNYDNGKCDINCPN